MNTLNDIEEYVQCFSCKGYFSKKEIKKVLAKPSFIQSIKGELNYNIVCLGCLKNGR